MREALKEARSAQDLGEVPIGAVVVYQGRIIARAHNTRETDENPSGHAEFSALMAASRVLGRWRLSGCTVYVTLEPCLMCAGLMVNARIDRCVYGARDPKGGALGSLYSLSDDARLNHRFALTAGVLEQECAAQLTSFFASLRARRAQDEGDGADEARRRLSEANRVRQQVAVGKGAAAQASSKSLSRHHPAASSGPRILLAIDSFKGCASSAQVSSWVREGIERADASARVWAVPVADGGEGTLDALMEPLAGTRCSCKVHDAFGRKICADYLLGEYRGARIAVIEVARIVGIDTSPCTPAAALAASTAGVGEAMHAALEQGVSAVYLALGGSATNDGGAGMLQALGARVLTAQGDDIDPGLAGLRAVASVDVTPALSRLGGARVVALTDVSCPLVGARGALRTFGPQKGLDDPASCDAWMLAFGHALDRAYQHARDLGSLVPDSDALRFRSVLSVPGAGAAGGMGAALLALGARVLPGAQTVLDIVGFDACAAQADVVITGEGSLDVQTSYGKVPLAVAQRAHRAHKPVIALAGARADNLDSLYGLGIDAVLPILRRPMDLDEAIARDQARMNMICAGETAVRLWGIAHGRHGGAKGL